MLDPLQFVKTHLEARQRGQVTPIVPGPAERPADGTLPQRALDDLLMEADLGFLERYYAGRDLRSELYQQLFKGHPSWGPMPYERFLQISERSLAVLAYREELDQILFAVYDLLLPQDDLFSEPEIALLSVRTMRQYHASVLSMMGSAAS
jgi:hypothetical protein